MTELSQKVLNYLRSSSKKSFVITDLMYSENLHLSDISAEKVISELEDNGRIIIHTEWINRSFELV